MSYETATVEERQKALSYAYQIVTDNRNMNKYSMSQIRDANTMETFGYGDMLRVLRVMHDEIFKSKEE